MALSKAQKEEVLKETEGALASASSVVFVNFHGLTVANATLLRRGLAEQGVRYRVVKKTLLDRALGKAKLEGELQPLTGEVAIAYSEDAIASAKGIAEFAKKFKEQMKILGGIFEKKYVSIAEVQSLASIPSREVLLAKLANVLNSPIQGLATALSGIPRSLVVVLNGISNNKK